MFSEKSRNADQDGMVPLKSFLHHLTSGRVVVIDIAPLPDYLQSFVVGDVLGMITHAKLGDWPTDEEDPISLPRNIIVFADELNKFAPRHGQNRSLTNHLREISERGRSLGIVLFGAEQFRSVVDNRVTGNSGTQVFGRTTAVEAGRDPEIKELPRSQKSRITFLQKGEILVSHARFSSGTLKLRFPRNAYQPG